MSNTYLSSVSYNYSNNGITDQDHVKSIKSDIESVIESIARAICDKDITTVDKVIDYLDNYKQNRINEYVNIFNTSMRKLYYTTVSKIYAIRRSRQRRLEKRNQINLDERIRHLF